VTDFLALAAIAIAIVLTVQLWLFVDAMRRVFQAWLYEVLSIRTWTARGKAAIAAREAREAAHWQDEQGRVYAYDFDLERITELQPARTATPDVPLARQWQIALIKACQWGEMIGFTEKSWKDNGVVYSPETDKHYEQGRRDIVKELDRLGITAGGSLGERTWAAGMSYQAAVERIESAPPSPKWGESHPPTVRLPAEPAKARTHEPNM
jgi:hypothetical protein